MILSGNFLSRAYHAGALGIHPEPEIDQFQPASLDIRIGEELVDVWADEKQNKLSLKPNIFYLGTTLETISMPDDAAAILTGRSTIGRMGCTVHCTAGFIDPGFEGTITLEMYNFSGETVEFEVGDRIGQLIFFEVKDPGKGYSGQYQNQDGVTQPGTVK